MVSVRRIHSMFSTMLIAHATTHKNTKYSAKYISLLSVLVPIGPEVGPKTHPWYYFLGVLVRLAAAFLAVAKAVTFGW